TKGKKIKYEVELINRKGKLLVPFGKFTEIEKFNEGIAPARVVKEIKTKSGETTDEVFIDVAGNILFVVDEEIIEFDSDKCA
ncbi:WG repeat-containing protein, partial [Rhizobium leguminosarum]|uniref:WG repeat-containing protein n=1 Tax=Rhizobium leguminosarum TaxID=384 RepID=UPI003F9C3A3A